MRDKTLSQKIKEITFGICTSLLDAVLLEIKLMGRIASGEKITMQNLQRVLDEELGLIPKHSVFRTFAHAREKGLVNIHGTLTQKGEQKLANTLPLYQPLLQWDGNWMFVIFDIPEKLRFKRNILRAYLGQWKFGRLQDSVWVSFRDATEELLALCALYKIGPPYILFWKTKEIGMDQKSAAQYIWHLKELNERYEEYVEEYRSKKNALSGVAAFLAIAQDDPQLPLKLLPPSWRGEEAFDLYQQLLNQKH